MLNMLSNLYYIKIDKKLKIWAQIFLFIILFALVQTTSSPNSSPPQKRGMPNVFFVDSRNL